MTTDQGTVFPARNHLLAALPSTTYDALLPALEPLALNLKQILYAPNEPITHVYFPVDGVCSIVSLLENNIVIEVATVGHEGMVGIPVFLGAMHTPGQALVQVPGAAVRMEVQAFRQALEEYPHLGAVLQRYTQALFVQIAQSTACNRAHPVNERCARWLLMTADRMRRDQFSLTQEFLGQMLGVRRASVNVAARTLQQAGLIDYSRGQITILDRAGLESVACECYGIIKAEYDRLLD
jgi:CRP-like cAMP-binding protein